MRFIKFQTGSCILLLLLHLAVVGFQGVGRSGGISWRGRKLARPLLVDATAKEALSSASYAHAPAPVQPPRGPPSSAGSLKEGQDASPPSSVGHNDLLIVGPGVLGRLVAEKWREINRYAFSGGRDSIENHRKYGADLEVDIPVKYLSFFLDDDAKLEHIRKEYGSGRMLTGEVKELTDVLTALVERHRKARAEVTEEYDASHGGFEPEHKVKYMT